METGIIDSTKWKWVRIDVGSQFYNDLIKSALNHPAAQYTAPGEIKAATCSYNNKNYMIKIEWLDEVTSGIDVYEEV